MKRKLALRFVAEYPCNEKQHETSKRRACQRTDRETAGIIASILLTGLVAIRHVCLNQHWGLTADHAEELQHRLLSLVRADEAVLGMQASSQYLSPELL